MCGADVCVCVSVYTRLGLCPCVFDTGLKIVARVQIPLYIHVHPHGVSTAPLPVNVNVRVERANVYTYRENAGPSVSSCAYTCMFIWDVSLHAHVQSY